MDVVPVVADSTSTAKIAPFMKEFPVVWSTWVSPNRRWLAPPPAWRWGKIAVTCNAAPFLISRANEQIKVDICYNNTNVKLIGLNAGASYGPRQHTSQY